MEISQINFNNFKLEPELLLKQELEETEKVLRSGWWVLGENVLNFEQKWADYCETLKSAGVANGLDAIEIGLRSLGIGKGDEVITTSLTAFATCLGIIRCGATPVFADIEPCTGCIDHVSIKRCLSSKTKAILVVHLYGRSVDIDKIKEITDKEEIYLIEDCAQAHGASFKGKKLGSIGIFGAWSFYPTKNLGAIGDAGAITSNDINLIAKAKKIRNYGQSDRYQNSILGFNSRLDEIQASLLTLRMEYLDKWIKRRREIAKKYWENIQNKSLNLLQYVENDEEHAHHLFVLKNKNRDLLKSYLYENKIQTIIHYPIPCHLQKALKNENIRCDPKGLEKTEIHSRNCLSIPIHPFLKNFEVDYIIDKLNSYKK